MSKLPRISLKPEVTEFLQGVFVNEEVGGFSRHFFFFFFIQHRNTVTYSPLPNRLKKKYACISFVIYLELFVPSVDNVLNYPLPVIYTARC